MCIGWISKGFSERTEVLMNTLYISLLYVYAFFCLCISKRVLYTAGLCVCMLEMSLLYVCVCVWKRDYVCVVCLGEIECV